MAAMTRRQRERCERAIATLRALKLPKGAKLDMRFWGYHDNDDHSPPKDDYCGTAACAAGWLSLDPWFRKRGMSGQWHNRELHPFGDKPYQWVSLLMFFGLSDPEAEHIFGSHNRGTARACARRLQRVLDARDKEAR